MANNRESGQTVPARSWRSAVMAGALGLGAALLSGCSTPVANSQAADPLNGVLTPPGTMPQPASTAPKTASGWNPPPANQFGSADSSSTNNATLAGMTWQGPLGMPQPLAINDSNKTPMPGQLTTSSKTLPTQQTPSALAPNPNPKVEPVPDAKPTNPPVTPTGSWLPGPTNQPVAVPDAPAARPVMQAVGATPAPLRRSIPTCSPNNCKTEASSTKRSIRFRAALS